MCNESGQEKSVAGWGIFLNYAKALLADAKDRKRRKELQKSIRAFEILIHQNARMPQFNRHRRKR